MFPGRCSRRYDQRSFPSFQPRISRKEVLPDTVSFPNINNGKDLRRNKWLRRCTLPDGSSTQSTTPIAHWQRRDNACPLSLVLYTGIEGFHPQIITAFVIQELKMGMAEKADLMALTRAIAKHNGFFVTNN
ncbi:hypothetical protein B0H16DRAFT_1384948 [Mycena metata]|uniref:Uncharacterized protein n=1 Tax=Mycena metata TaxID=1033252 RepID=A0AAD7HMW9_9AGAR|nr:hypothetical protein B0H16DRAFT_1384948 [Mycena metata]